MNPSSSVAESSPANADANDQCILLRLYVSGTSENSHRALVNLRSFIQQHPERRILLEVIDLMSEPQRGVSDGIIVTPTLLKITPLPGRRVVGDLNHTLTLRIAIGVEP